MVVSSVSFVSVDPIFLSRLSPIGGKLKSVRSRTYIRVLTSTVVTSFSPVFTLEVIPEEE